MFLDKEKISSTLESLEHFSTVYFVLLYFGQSRVKHIVPTYEAHSKDM